MDKTKRKKYKTLSSLFKMSRKENEINKLYRKYFISIKNSF